MGPLKGYKIIEFAGIGPGPFCAMMLSDMGADIIRLDRKGATARFDDPKYEVLHRGRRSAAIDLKHPEGKKAALKTGGRCRCRHRRIQTGRYGKTGPRSGGLPESKSQARLWPNDRMGSERTFIQCVRT